MLGRPRRLRFGDPGAPARAAAALLAAAVWLAAGIARAQLPDALQGSPADIEQSVRSLGSRYEAAWNVWLIQSLRLRLSANDASRVEADSLDDRLRLVAQLEPSVLGTRVGLDALACVERWTRDERAARVRAFAAESLAAAALRADGIDAARPLYREALDLYRRLGERRRTAVLLGGYGSALFTSRAYGEADSIFHLALEARRAIGDRRLEGNSLNDLGVVSYQRDRPSDAVPWLIQAARVRETTGQPALLGTTLNYLALAMSSLGRRDSVEQLYRRALALTESVGDSARMLTVLVNFGGWLSERGDVDEAMTIDGRARDQAHRGGDAAKEAEALLNLGLALGRRARFSEAIDVLDQSILRAGEAEDPERVTRTLIQLGLTWLDVPDAPRARQPLQRARELADSIGDVRLQVKALNDLALTADIERLPEEARQRAGEALRRAAASGDSLAVREVANTMGNLRLTARDTSGCVAWFRRAAAATRAVSDADRAADVIDLGWAELFVGEDQQALARFEEGLKLATGIHAPDLEWPAHHGIGEVAERRGDFQAALEQMREAARLIDTLRFEQHSTGLAVKVFAGRLGAFESLVHLLGKLENRQPGHGYAEEAFDWAERARARTLRDLLEANGVVAPRAEPPSLARVGAPFAPDEALLYYSLGDSSSTVWLIRHDRWRRRTLPRRELIATRVALLRDASLDLERADSPLTAASSLALYRMLVGPVEDDLGGIRRLRIAPDGPLWQLPFEALVTTPPGQGTAGERAHFAVERWDVSYVPSAQIMMSPAAGNAGGGIFAVADPDYLHRSRTAPPGGAPRLPRLAGTLKETDILQALAGRGPIKVLTGRDASRAGVLRSPQLRSASIIHIGAHGDVATEPERSGIWLAPDSSGAPSKMTVADILELRPHASLATLSACQTGLGELERGEGIIGLTRAFLAGGTRSVIVSLWDATDEWTPALMERFYRGYLREGLPADAALAKAKRDLIAGTPARAPFYWALFVLVGSPDPLRHGPGK